MKIYSKAFIEIGSNSLLEAVLKIYFNVIDESIVEKAPLIAHI